MPPSLLSLQIPFLDDQDLPDGVGLFTGGRSSSFNTDEFSAPLKDEASLCSRTEKSRKDEICHPVIIRENSLASIHEDRNSRGSSFGQQCDQQNEKRRRSRRSSLGDARLVDDSSSGLGRESQISDTSGFPVSTGPAPQRRRRGAQRRRSLGQLTMEQGTTTHYHTANFSGDGFPVISTGRRSRRNSQERRPSREEKDGKRSSRMERVDAMPTRQRRSSTGDLRTAGCVEQEKVKSSAYDEILAIISDHSRILLADNHIQTLDSGIVNSSEALQDPGVRRRRRSGSTSSRSRPRRSASRTPGVDDASQPVCGMPTEINPARRKSLSSRSPSVGRRSGRRSSLDNSRPSVNPGSLARQSTDTRTRRRFSMDGTSRIRGASKDSSRRRKSITPPPPRRSGRQASLGGSQRSVRSKSPEVAPRSNNNMITATGRETSMDYDSRTIIDNGRRVRRTARRHSVSSGIAHLYAGSGESALIAVADC